MGGGVFSLDLGPRTGGSFSFWFSVGEPKRGTREKRQPQVAAPGGLRRHHRGALGESEIPGES